ncbi:hypothetical protein AVEN_258991-1 [Araneus ventricosus]|uniref:Uncharacterized protein n=1 Tax=Araneus ventricosus TaxID=182803 RepID=A0A4Y2R4C1_ARAVE|nr:hypothetical protein AVEN_95104-1 [Araneus ventricosus]GBN70491.1 hypothetical protein AVEN_128528-1 [Araneus ventricosus]GBN70514.1 hypothetical protein AVEN_190041-1 [Araneus ventricosus]GBN70526.1 hypothetical protein AVEN_258991-1 [Araneus ventricosus]
METFVTTLYPCRRQGFQNLSGKLSLLSGVYLKDQPPRILTRILWSDAKYPSPAHTPPLVGITGEARSRLFIQRLLAYVLALSHPGLMTDRAGRAAKFLFQDASPAF